MFVGLVLVGYGSLQAWVQNLSYDSPTKQKFCSAWLCPEEFWDTRTFTMLQQSAGGASARLLPDFQRALKEDSASAYAWANLAEVERDAQQYGKAKYSFHRAIMAGPANPAILFRAANFAFLMGDKDEAMRDLSVVLRDPELPSYYPAVFLTYSRLDASMPELLDKGVPPLSSAAEPFLEFWMDDKKIPEAKATWAWMVQHNLTTEKATGDYTAFLVNNHEIAAAQEEWKRANAKSDDSSYQTTNWVFNGGFETEPKLGPFDWHLESTPDVEATRVQDTSRDGQYSVRLAFNGQTNVDYHGVYQDTVLSPGQWHLRAFLKLDGITTDQGVSLRVYDVDNPNRLDVRTDAKTGTFPWSEVSLGFAAGPETKLVRVEVMRALSRKIDSKIAGHAWVDSVQLSPIH